MTLNLKIFVKLADTQNFGNYAASI